MFRLITLNRLLGDLRLVGSKVQFGSSANPRPTHLIKDPVQMFDRALANFEERTSINGIVPQRSFNKLERRFRNTIQQLQESNQMTNLLKKNYSDSSKVLLSSCGKYMIDCPPNERIEKVKSLWSFLEEKQLPIDRSHYNCLIRIYNENNIQYDPKEILDKMAEAELIPDSITYQGLLHRYCDLGDISSATELLEKMKSENLKLTESIFASLIMGYGKQENPPAVKEIFDLMQENRIQPSEDSYHAAIMSLVSRLDEGQDVQKELLQVLDQVSSKMTIFREFQFSDVYSALSSHKSIPEVAEFLEYISHQHRMDRVNLILVRKLIDKGDLETASSISWKRIGNMRGRAAFASNYLRELVKSGNSSIEFIIEECTRIMEQNILPKPFQFLFYVSADNKRIDIARAALEKIRDLEIIRCVHIWPLLAQARDQEEIIRVLENDLSPQMDQKDLVFTFANWVWPRFTDNYNRLFNVATDLGYSNDVLIKSLTMLVLRLTRPRNNAGHRDDQTSQDLESAA